MKRTLLLFALLFAVTIGATKADSRNVNAATALNNNTVNLTALAANAKLLTLAPVAEQEVHLYAFETSCGPVFMTTDAELTDRQSDILWVTFEISCWV